MATQKSFSLRLLLVSVLLVIAHGQPEVHVPRQKATYKGSAKDAIEQFQNIRFAEDTSGKNRFAPPQPHVPEVGSMIDASQAGSVCPQSEPAMPLAFDPTPEMSEDCLNLRIARPAEISADSKVPVVVWLHGGGVVKGSAYDSHFNPERLLRLSQNDGTPVIFAALNYRLSIFGFPRLPVLKSQKSLNVGFKDQRVGLQWIKDNIAAFGGDPDRITVYGLSAGGTFASLHTLAYGGEQGVPFQQAWMMSGPPGTALNMSSDATTAHTKAVAKRVECKGGDEQILACLRGLPMKDLLEAAMTYSRENHPPAGLFTFIPSIDDDIFPDRQTNLVRQGRFVKGIKMIFGWTHNDGSMNSGPPQMIQSEENMVNPIKAFAHDLSPEHFSKLFELYPASAFQEEYTEYESRKSEADPEVSVNFFRVSRILRDLLFACSSIEFGYQMYKQSRETLPDFNSVRLYDLNQSVFTPMMAGAGMPYAGVIHGSDTPFIFNGLPEGALDEDHQKLATSFARTLFQFAYTGTVDGAASPGSSFKWPEAYHSLTSSETSLMPSDFIVEVIGGPHGTGPVLVKDEANAATYAGLDTQGILNNMLEFTGMKSPSATIREQLIKEEELHRRCTYINSLDDVLGR